jgi:hypothetical protein
MARLNYGLLEGPILENVQGVVVDEDADGALQGQQVRRVFHGVPDSIQPRRWRDFIPAQRATTVFDAWRRPTILFRSPDPKSFQLDPESTGTGFHSVNDAAGSAHERSYESITLETLRDAAPIIDSRLCYRFARPGA